jgi:Yip1 domain/zinc-ribbon domain
MVCPKCNNSVSAGARFCGHCGQVLEAGPASGPQFTAATAAAGGAAPPNDGFTASAGMASGVPPYGAAAARTPAIVARIKGILLTPKTEWPVIAREPTTTAELYTGYVMLLAAFTAVLSLVRSSVIGVRVPFGDTVRLPLTTGLMSAVVAFVMGLIGIFVVGVIINVLAPTFGGQKDQRQALKTAAYAFTPGWLSAVFYLLPSMGTLLQFLAGVYGIYLLYLGLPVLMRSKPDKAVGYTATVVICTIVLFMVIGAVMAGFGVGLGRMAGLGPTAESQEIQREQAAAQTGNVIGNMLGTDEQGKAGLQTAISNMMKAGEEAERQQRAAAASGSNTVASAAGGAAAAAGAAGASTAGAVAGTADAPNIASATGGLVSALGGALGGSKRVAAVDFHSLEALLPDSLPGMTRVNAEGSDQAALGVKTSSAVGDYKDDKGGHVKVKITDVSAVSGLMDIANGMVGATHSESSTGYEKDVTVSGRSLHEKYDAQAESGEVDTVVAKRFDVDVSGEKVNMEALVSYLGSVDFGKLEAMKDVGAQK